MRKFINAIADHVTGADIKRADQASTERAIQRAHIRVATLREKFREVRKLSEAMNARLDEYKDRRAG